MVNEQSSGIEWAAFPSSAGRVDLLLGHAMVMDDRWDGVSVLIGEAMGIALLMAAQYPARGPVWVPGLREMSLSECVDAALIEVQEWDLCWSVDLPDMTRLRVLLSDLRRELAADAKRRG
jgi:hypothetical protein